MHQPNWKIEGKKRSQHREVRDWLIEPPRGKKPVISWEAVTDLKIDPEYQRAIDSAMSQRLIQNMACRWDWTLCSVLTVSDRGADGLFVVDGQHRLAAAKIREDISHLPCLSVQISDRVNEAKLFVAINTERRNPTALDRFHARCIAGDERSLAILALVKNAGLSVGKSPWSMKGGEVCAVAIMERLYRQYGGVMLSAALVNMAEAWPGEPLRIANEMLPGLCLLHFSNYDNVDVDLIADVLKSRQQIQWFAGAKTHEGEDPMADWPDEVFRDIILTRYHALADKLKDAAA